MKDNRNTGIYIHIPFCKRKCDYCDFYSIEGGELIVDFMAALKREISRAPGSLQNLKIDTIYFGGGTPSILSSSFLSDIISLIHSAFACIPDPEITLECNPCTVTPKKATQWKTMGFNRISLGAQSFHEKDLKFLKRLHSVPDIYTSLSCLQEAGFTNINIDLIFGMPGQTVNDLKFNLEKSLSLNVPHLSVYGLTIEKGTPLYQGLKRNTFKRVNDEIYEAMFLTAHACLEEKGYIHYEISNYAKGGYKSKHNLNCWQGRDYLGFGPSAHSRVADLRWANPEDIEAYLKDPTKRSFNKKLTENEIRLEEMMLGLRTRYGISIPQTDHAEHIGALKKKKLLEQIGNRIFLTANGMLLLDEIILFLEGKRA